MSRFEYLPPDPQTMSGLCRLVSDFDGLAWGIGETPPEIVRHVVLHLAKAVGELAAGVERFEHNPADGIDLGARRDALLADLVIHACRLNQLLGSRPLLSVVMERMFDNASRYAPAHPLTSWLEDGIQGGEWQ